MTKNSLAFSIQTKRIICAALVVFLTGVFGIALYSFADGTYVKPKRIVPVSISDFEKMYNQYMEYAVETKWLEPGYVKDGHIIILKAMESEYNEKAKMFCKEEDWKCTYPPYRLDTSKINLR